MLDLVSAYENYLSKVKQASSNTVSSYLRDIRQFAQWLSETENVSVVDATQLHISDYLTCLEEDGRSGSTISRCLASLKNFFSYLVSSGFLENTPIVDIHIDRGDKKLPCVLSGYEIELLLNQPVCIEPKGFRDKAMLEVMYATGIRVSELIDLNIDDVNLDKGTIKCTGGKKSRIIPLYPAALTALSNAAASTSTWKVTVLFSTCFSKFLTIMGLIPPMYIPAALGKLVCVIGHNPNCSYSIIS
jgi:integrase/recombinase XerD